MKGYKIHYDNKCYEVIGSMNIRGKTSYIVKQVGSDEKQTFNREVLLKLQKAGKAFVTI
jgi:hypothetical protein